MNLMGIDVGTTSIKISIFNERLESLYHTKTDYSLEVHGDMVELDPDVFWSIIKNHLDTNEIPVDALSVDTQCETLIVTNESGQPLRKAIIWLDNRATQEAELIADKFGNKRVYEVTGQPEITATWPAAKLLWIKRNEPEIWNKTKRIFLLEDYILFKMTGQFVTEKTLQSSTIYFDITRGSWWEEMLDYIGVSTDQLPQIKDSGEYIGDYKGIRVVSGAMDQVAGSIGAGVLEEGVMSEMIGTAMVLFSPCKTIPAYNPSSIVPCHYNFDGSYCMLLWSPTAGMALNWFREKLCEEYTFAQLDLLAEKIPVGCDGLTFLPYLCGSTMPKYNPSARGSFTGLTPEHTRGHFVRSIMEAIACMLKDFLEYSKVDVHEIRSMGGGANSNLWNQMKSDMTGFELLTLENKETACLGSAVLAGLGSGVFGTVKEASEFIKVRHRYHPSGEDYSEVYRRYVSMDQKLN